MKLKNILFDLDGTLTDPKTGIINSITYALEKLGHPVPEPDTLLWCIGPPLLKSFGKILGDKNGHSARQALTYYREYFNHTGKFENKVYSGVPELLCALNVMDLSLFIATSKPRVFAEDIADHFDLTRYFEKIYGSKLNGELVEKDRLIAHIIREENLHPQQTIMIGDRKYDIFGAKQSNLKSIGVTFGYGGDAELRESKADYLARNPTEVLGIIRGLNHVIT